MGVVTGATSASRTRLAQHDAGAGLPDLVVCSEVEAWHVPAHKRMPSEVSEHL